MISTDKIFDPRKLEKLLIKDWTEFIDIRKLLNFLKTNAENKFNINSPKIDTVIVSNCEMNETGIFLWIDYKLLYSNNIVNITLEVKLNRDGTLENIKTI